MIENILHGVEGIHLYGIVSVCLFFVFCTGMLVWAIRLKKTYLNSMRDLPLDGREVGTHKPSKTESDNE